jgi:hypothetical protein
MPHFFRYCLTRMGELISPGQIGNLKGSLRYLELGSLLRQMGYPLERVKNLVGKREDLYDLIGAEVADRDVLYMEFGVFEGYATRYWSNLLRNPKSKLHGFDSFEGLPEAWIESKRVMDKGHFSTDGAIPVFDDPRVQFFKGWFDQTLATYVVPDHEVLVINFDADLYSSTKCVFDKMASYIVPGTYLYFDEFNDPQHELRAFGEFRTACKYRFELRGATALLRQVVFECVE